MYVSATDIVEKTENPLLALLMQSVMSILARGVGGTESIAEQFKDYCAAAPPIPTQGFPPDPCPNNRMWCALPIGSYSLDEVTA